MEADNPKDEHNPRSRNRRFSGMLLIAVLIAVMALISYRPAVTAIYCDIDILDTRPDVIMLGTSWCPYCYQARRYFTNNAIHYCEYNIEQSEQGQRLYNRLGGGAIPILIIGKHRLSGFDQRAIDKALTLLHSS